MIPALLAVPMAQGILGGVVGGVVNAIAPAKPSGTTPPFSPYIDRVAKPTAPVAAPLATITPTGVLRAADWHQMNPGSVQSWATSLAGHHVDATDESGRTISGIVSSAQPVGSTVGLNIGGHFVSLSHLKQISWSPAIV